jgi:hypothetical protein
MAGRRDGTSHKTGLWSLDTSIDHHFRKVSPVRNIRPSGGPGGIHPYVAFHVAGWRRWILVEPIPELGTLGLAGQDDSIPLEHFPDHRIKAVLATEDRHFYEHFGIDMPGTARAVLTTYYDDDWRWRHRRWGDGYAYDACRVVRERVETPSGRVIIRTRRECCGGRL